jgi:glucokinase
MKNIIGIDIGGTKCAVLLGCENNGTIDISERNSFPTEKEKPQAIIEKFINIIELLLKRHNLKSEDIFGIGISCGGPLDADKGIIMSPPNLIGWDNIEITSIIEKRLNIPTHLQNDANACALAEWHFGAGRDTRNLVFLTFGTGLGAGLILDGKLYNGSSYMAGEIGHVRLAENGPVGYGKAGSCEGFCSGGGLAQLGQTLVLERLQRGEKVSFCSSVEELHKLDAKKIATAAEQGDELALEIYSVCGSYLGKCLSIIIDFLNPDMIVIGSIYTRSEQLFKSSMEAVIEKETLFLCRSKCRIVPSKLGDKIGDYAALSTAL